MLENEKGKQQEVVKQMLSEPLDAVITIRLSLTARQALREVASYYGVSEQDLIRRMVAVLVTTFQDLKSQISLGVTSFDELLSRSTRLTVAQFISMPPADLRRAADEFKKAAYALANLIEGDESNTK
jgi:hypothetical protein